MNKSIREVLFGAVVGFALSAAFWGGLYVWLASPASDEKLKLIAELGEASPGASSYLANEDLTEVSTIKAQELIRNLSTINAADRLGSTKASQAK